MAYAGRTSVFAGSFKLPKVGVDYEVLEIRVTAAQSDAVNFGVGRQGIKLQP